MTTNARQPDPYALADGAPLQRWEDETVHRRIYHVANQHSKASDEEQGTEDRPFRTIGQAAAVAGPGDRVVVHAGTYRETVAPQRGGERPDRMVAYVAAPGERVVITGAETWRPQYRQSEGWSLGLAAGTAKPAIWMADLPRSLFSGYHPFEVRNVYAYLARYGNLTSPDWLRRTLLMRGRIFDGEDALFQALSFRELAEQDGTFWVEPGAWRIHLRPKHDGPPPEILELTAREQAFAPEVFGLGYVKVSGFAMNRVADGIPVPQRACLSANRGHHWIIEDNCIEQANALGMDIGWQSWEAEPQPVCGGHIVRNNVIRDCGIGGIAGAGGVEDCLIEDNVIERIGWQNLERLYECAAIKFHFAKRTLIRGNRIREMRDACGIWLDVDTVNCRVSGNSLCDIRSRIGGIYSELNFGFLLVDGNELAGIGLPDGPEAEGATACGVRADCNDCLTVQGNRFEAIDGIAVNFSRQQEQRAVRGQRMAIRANRAVGNTFVRCPLPIEFGQAEGCSSEGNSFDELSGAGCRAAVEGEAV
jgi:hypothetical protein